MDSNEFDEILIEHDQNYLAEHPEIAAEYDKQKQNIIPNYLRSPVRYTFGFPPIDFKIYKVTKEPDNTTSRHEAIKRVNEYIQKKNKESVRKQFKQSYMKDIFKAFVDTVNPEIQENIKNDKSSRDLQSKIGDYIKF